MIVLGLCYESITMYYGSIRILPGIYSLLYYDCIGMIATNLLRCYYDSIRILLGIHYEFLEFVMIPINSYEFLTKQTGWQINSS